jgi:hypothetical protein
MLMAFGSEERDRLRLVASIVRHERPEPDSTWRVGGISLAFSGFGRNSASKVPRFKLSGHYRWQYSRRRTSPEQKPFGNAFSVSI